MSHPARHRPFLLATAVALLALALAVSLPGAAFGKRTVGISSPSFQFSILPGGSGKGELVVSDDGDEPIKVLVYSANQNVDAKGKVTFSVPNRDTANVMTNPAAWVRFDLPSSTKSYQNTPYIELKPGEGRKVGFEFRTPNGIASGDHTVVLFFEVFDFLDQQSGSVSKVSGRIGSRVRIRVSGDLVERVAVEPFSVRTFVAGDQVPYVFTIRNGGNVDQRMTGYLSILGGGGAQRSRSLVMTEATVFAGTDREVSGSLGPQGLGLGIYTARLTLDYPTQDPGAVKMRQLVKEQRFYVVPPWLLVAVAAIVAALALWLLWRRSVRTARERGLAEALSSERATVDVRAPEEPAEGSAESSS